MNAATRRILAPLGVFLGAFSLAAALFYTVSASAAPAAAITPQAGLVPYTGSAYHVFFHSLVLYPELAFKSDGRGKLYEDYMITRSEFYKVLQSLYKNQFVLVDADSLFSVDQTGKVSLKPILVPKGKKPLIISLDDLNYYQSMKGRGFADKLVFDQSGRVATEVVLPSGESTTTRDGDIVPILDDFVRLHPDFSVGGAKGVIAVTGREGVLGYRTQAGAPLGRASEIGFADKISAALRAEGWRFASHSYSHDAAFSTGAIGIDELKADIAKWKAEVEPIVGKTDIYVGPFGQIFQEGDPRRALLVASGFRLLCGVGADGYFRAFPDHIIMDRADIDGVRLMQTPRLLNSLFDPAGILDPARLFAPIGRLFKAL